ncbi:MAG: NADH-quinone oxidoreductase subunit NuoE [Acidobacteria bacterium]|nr:MAG: NADH-quinone oxidoreductase subunit NuoE [Acidobacteriota bacterium]
MKQVLGNDHDALVDILEHYPRGERDGLIPLLQEVQQREGYVSKNSVVRIGQYLNLPSSKIYGVATFYNQFRFAPLGKYHISVCRGTACHVKGSKNILDILEKSLEMKAGQTSRDGLFSLEVVACIGACGLAPVISVNGEFYANMDEEKIENLLAELKNQAELEMAEVVS